MTAPLLLTVSGVSTECVTLSGEKEGTVRCHKLFKMHLLFYLHLHLKQLLVNVLSVNSVFVLFVYLCFLVFLLSAVSVASFGTIITKSVVCKLSWYLHQATQTSEDVELT